MPTYDTMNQKFTVHQKDGLFLLCGVMCKAPLFCFFGDKYVERAESGKWGKEVTYTGLVRTPPYCGVLTTENFDERGLNNGSGSKSR